MKTINKRCNKLLVILVILITFIFVYCTNGANYFNDYVEATYIRELNDININKESESDKFNLFTVSNKLSSQDTKELPPNYSSQSLIEINSNIFVEDNISVGDTIGFEIPEVGIYEAIIDKVSTDVNNILSYRALIKDSEYSYIIISINNNMLTANINLIEENKQYTITYKKSNKNYYLNNIDNSNEILCKEENHIGNINNNEHSSYKGFSTMSTNDLNLDDDVTIDVMFVYTKDAKEWADSNVGSIDLAISNALEYGQLTLDNSNVGINLRMVYTYGVDYISTDSTETDLYKISGHDDEYMNEVHDLRDEYGADLVVLIGCEYTDAAGRAYLPSNIGSLGLGFSVSDVRALSGSVMIHEIGHNMGSHHSRNQIKWPALAGGGAFKYSTGWRWIGNDGKGYVSTMTYSEGDKRVPFFSNPDINYMGVPTGSYQGEYSPADNARSLREMKHIIANYRLEPSIGNLPAIIEDSSFLEGIREELNEPVKVITKQDMNKIETLSIENKNIKNISGIEECIHLKMLHLKGNQIQNIKSLTNLKLINRLNLDFNLIEDITPISNLKNLDYLSLGGNNINDISPLNNLNKLWYLGLGENSIIDISALNNLTNLRYLNLYWNSIVDISPLSNLTKLTDLKLSRNNIIDIKPLEKLLNVTTLKLRHNNITDITHLKDLKKIDFLDVSVNNIKDISILSQLVNIKNLYIQSNRIKDISSLVGFVENRTSTDSIIIDISWNYLDEENIASQNMIHINEILQYPNVSLNYKGQKTFNVKVFLKENEKTLYKNMSYNLKPIIDPENYHNTNMIWTSSDENIVSVDENGLIKGINVGTAIVTVEMEDGGYYDTCEITVIERDYDLNNDGNVDNKDIVMLKDYYGKDSEDQLYNIYFDYNYDNRIDLLDIVLLSKQIKK